MVVSTHGFQLPTSIYLLRHSSMITLIKVTSVLASMLVNTVISPLVSTCLTYWQHLSSIWNTYLPHRFFLFLFCFSGHFVNEALPGLTTRNYLNYRMLECPKDGLKPLLCPQLTLNELIHSPSFKYHLYANDSHVYLSSSDMSCQLHIF